MKRYVHPYAPLIIALVGLFFLGMGFFRMDRMNRFPATEAVITDIEAYYDTDDTLDHDVTVSLTVDGKTYEGKLDHYKDSFEIGNRIEVRYDPKDPTTVLYASNFPTYGTMAFGAFLLAVAGYALIQLKR